MRICHRNPFVSDEQKTFDRILCRADIKWLVIVVLKTDCVPVKWSGKIKQNRNTKYLFRYNIAENATSAGKIASRAILSIKSTSFNVRVRYFVWNFKGTVWNSTQNILPIHWKIWFLYNTEILKAPRFKSPYAFWTPPPPPPQLLLLYYLTSYKLMG